MNIRDVAAAAGVSVATVSRVLSPKPGSQTVRPETRQRVLEVVDRVGYRPNDLARALLQDRTATVGLVLPDISNPYYPPLVRGVEDAASTLGYRVMLCNTDRDEEKTATYVDTLIKTRVDGIIIAGGSTTMPMLRDVFEPYRTKVVVVGRHELEYPSIQVDNVAAMGEVIGYLTGLGHRRIGFIAGPASSITVQDRVEGYRAALRAAGIGYNEDLVREGDLQEQSGYDVAGELAAQPTRPTALVAANDRMAVGAMAALTDAGLRVPADVSLVGFDDVSLASYIRPALTTVSVPTYDMGGAAMELLAREFEEGGGTPEPGARVLSTTLMVRESCAAPPR
ncbi:LacI family transcriptional regulator [Lipingzhangella halophila]|uniref:LacI family transcriptional regulator n=1 Tax=Lipingzhangella halophila TaxID=1783352 RepID=A0A7W7RNU9_9ACTN|nr:LacI family DNA-binding transcriptional regulator [Lipingzhangella halophila]MBB4934928.1 LacI family transcriptional regulator [Lipingzhangella halophila]